MEKIRFEYGSIYTGDGSCIIENPAVMYDSTFGTLHAWGDSKNVKAKYDRWTGNVDLNLDPLFPNLVFLTFDKFNMTNEQIFKILYDMLHIHGYCKTFHEEYIQKS